MGTVHCLNPNLKSFGQLHAKTWATASALSRFIWPFLVSAIALLSAHADVQSVAAGLTHWSLIWTSWHWWVAVRMFLDHWYLVVCIANLFHTGYRNSVIPSLSRLCDSGLPLWSGPVFGRWHGFLDVHCWITDMMVRDVTSQIILEFHRFVVITTGLHSREYTP